MFIIYSNAQNNTSSRLAPNRLSSTVKSEIAVLAALSGSDVRFGAVRTREMPVNIEICMCISVQRIQFLRAIKKKKKTFIMTSWAKN